MVDGIASALPAIFILFAVGALIGTWAMSGTLVAMVYYALGVLSPTYFYLSACVVCALVAGSIGSSWTVVATIGLGLMGVAAEMDLSPAVTAGAVISGAYFGDKMSPLSDTVNLAAAAAGCAAVRSHPRLAGDLDTRAPPRLASVSGCSAARVNSTPRRTRRRSPPGTRSPHGHSCRFSWWWCCRCSACRPFSPFSAALWRAV